MDHQQLIPERDSGPTPKPRNRTKISTKPKSRGLKLNENDIDDVISLSSITSASSGVDNKGFTYDEPLSLQSKRPAHQVPEEHKVKSKYFSSDSENENVPQTRRHTFMADVHQSPPVTQKENQPQSSTWRMENEIPVKSNKRPKPKPRQIFSDSDASQDSVFQIDDNKSQPKQSSKSTKRDYMALTIQPNKMNHQEDDESDDTNSDIPEKLNSTQDDPDKWNKPPHSILTLSETSDTEDSAIERAVGSSRTMKNQKPDTRIDIETLNNNANSEIKVSKGSNSNNGKTQNRNGNPEEDDTKSERKPKKFLGEDEDDDDDRDEEVEDIMDKRSPEQSTKVKRSAKREQRRATESIDKYFGVTVHSCDLLPMDPNIIHPVVKMTILNESGSGIMRYELRQDALSTPRTHRHKSKSERTEQGKKDRSRGDPSSRNKLKMTSSSSGSTQVPRLNSHSVMPTMTQPCKSSYYLPTFAPNWNELLLFEEPFDYIVNPDSMAILFFEIMDFLPVRGPRSNSKLFGGYHGCEAGWYKVAWGFLKLIGTNGIRNVGRKMRLQLFKPESLPAKYLKDGLEVYHWWSLNKRNKINSTLYVTVKAVKPPAKTSTSLRTLLTMRKDHLAQAIIDSQLKTPTSARKRGSNTSADMVTRKTGRMDVTKSLPQWTRLEGQSCKVPNKVLKSLPVSQIESLNLTISGNVQCVKFSPCGLKLAAGLDTEELHTILVFEVPSGKLLCSIRCHHGLIYDLDWKILGETNSPIPRHYYLASASADTTATIWEIKSNHESPRLVKKLLHTSFVYCVKVHPTKSNLVVTGCFDHVIRIWDIERVSPSRANLHTPETESLPIVLLDRHESFINCFTFDHSGNHLFVGDGSGCVCDWTSRAPAKKKSWRVEREKSFRESGTNAINCLTVHPNGNRLLVHIRNSSIQLLDVATFLVLHSFSGLVNEKLQIQSCFSPCGSLVLSGSEDATLCVWDADTGSILQFLNPGNHKNCCVTSVHYHPFDHFVVIGLSSAISEPSPIVLYTHKSSKMSKIRSVARMVHMTSRQGTSTDLTSSYDEAIKIGHESSTIERGDSSDRFMMIVKKLDAALKLTKRPTQNLSEQTIASQTSFPEQDSIEKWQQTSQDIPSQGPRGQESPQKLLVTKTNNESEMDSFTWRKPKIVNAKPTPIITEMEGKFIQSEESNLKINNKHPSPIKRRKQQQMEFHSDIENPTQENLVKKISSGLDVVSDHLNNNKSLDKSQENNLIVRTNVEEPEKDVVDSPESNGQSSRVRQKRRERIRRLYETSDFVD